MRGRQVCTQKLKSGRFRRTRLKEKRSRGPSGGRINPPEGPRGLPGPLSTSLSRPTSQNPSARAPRACAVPGGGVSACRRRPSTSPRVRCGRSHLEAAQARGRACGQRSSLQWRRPGSVTQGKGSRSRDLPCAQQLLHVPVGPALGRSHPRSVRQTLPCAAQRPPCAAQRRERLHRGHGPALPPGAPRGAMPERDVRGLHPAGDPPCVPSLSLTLIIRQRLGRLPRDWKILRLSGTDRLLLELFPVLTYSLWHLGML